ncbi:MULTISPECIES: hypothetical protein [unclassified Bradyrhizobium]|uniref:hypothetical protein n=1 Tax=unclassified Bradyrhizobium TaxID=2631580 RepID=UPI001CD7B62B|nr:MULTISPECIES: hypothetical protein [unclassified Bradyrhizobium]MCA1373570.1 hypothetical protein [Bradyrhizobium sp. IC4060]MCA1487213.1 hypothetical protein [Bradyrhizobium sp. IC4061]
MITKTELQHSLDDVLTEIRALGTPPSGDALRAWLNLYPAFKRDIIAYVTAWVDVETRAETAEPAPEEINRVVSRTMSRVQQLLDEADRQRSIHDLSAEIATAGHSLESFQRLLCIDSSILTSLAARLVRPATIPARLVREIAEALHRQRDAVRDYFRLPPLLATAHKARKRPTAKQVDFAYLIEHATLPEPDKKQWLAEQPDPVLQE